MVKHIPILFSTAMIQAILEGRKTQTRRIVKNNPTNIKWNPIVVNGYGGYCDEHGKPIKPKYEPGDILWVRETWNTREDEIVYKASPELFKQTKWYKSVKKAFDIVSLDMPVPENLIKWRPSIFMPKAACRIFLKIKSIKVEHLQDISEPDLFAEGIQYNVIDGIPVFLAETNAAASFMPKGFGIKGSGYKMNEKDLLFAHWAELWCKINGRESWDANPWVWVVEFEKTEQPEDFIK